MKPKFKDIQTWEQAELLLQPTFIRVIDNIRKQIEQSSWKATYEEIQTPLPGYILCLTKGDVSVKVNIWELCFQICFMNYPPTASHVASEQVTSTQTVEIDSSLIEDTGEVDWQSLETKTQQIVKLVFANLPNDGN